MLAGGRAGGMPQMVFEYILKRTVLILLMTSPSTRASALASPRRHLPAVVDDYTIEFEPFATTLEMEGSGAVVASLGTESGYVPYTAYSARKSYLKQHPEVIQSFTNAIQKGLDYVNSHSSEEIAKVISPHFKETPVDKLALIVERYKSQDTWKEDTVFEENSFTLLKRI